MALVKSVLVRPVGRWDHLVLVLALVKSMLVRPVGLWNHLVLVKSMLVRPVGLWNRPRTGNADGQVASGRGVPLRNRVGKEAERG